MFSEYLRGAIRRDDDAGGRKTAAVSMNFPSNLIGDVDCALTLEVQSNKVEYLAMRLFNAHLETNGEARELVLDGGTRARINWLVGSPSERVLEIFGCEIATAIEQAPFRRLEVLDGTDATRCVTMSDFTDSGKGAMITLSLGLRAGSKIYEKLFKSKSQSRYVVYSSVYPTLSPIVPAHL